jgi:hypothetical protein
MSVICSEVMCAGMCGERAISELNFPSVIKKSGKPTMEPWMLTRRIYRAGVQCRNGGNTVAFIEHLQQQRPTQGWCDLGWSELPQE